MKRTDAAGSQSGLFSDGDPGLAIPATVVDASWLNSVQEEICAVIEGFGGTINPAVSNQLMTLLDARYPRVPAGTKMVFYQAAAPAGWTQIVTQNDKALRVVSAAGGGSGGTHGLSSPPSLAHTHTGPSHTHDMSLHTHSQPTHTHDMSLHTHSQPTHTHTYATVIAHSHTFTGDALAAHNHQQYHSGADGSNQGNMSAGTAHSGTPGYTVDYTASVSAGTPTGTISSTGSASGTTAAGGGDATGAPSNNTTGAGGGDATGAPSNNTTGASGTGNTGSAAPTSFAPLYIDVIICQRS